MATPTTLESLIKHQNFGINIIILKALESIDSGEIQSIAVDDIKLTLHILVEGTQGNLTTVHKIFRRDNSNPDNVAFFAKVDAGHYTVRGELDADDLKADFLPLYEKNLIATLGYGTNPQLHDIIQVDNKVSNRVIIKFTSDKQDVIGTDVNTGKPIIGTKTRRHEAYWIMRDPAADFSHIYVVPKSTFNTPNKFLTIVAGLFGGIDPSLLSIDVDPTLANVENVTVNFSSNSLTYSGSVSVRSPNTTGPIQVFDETTGKTLNTFKSLSDVVASNAGTTSTGTTTTPPVPTPSNTNTGTGTSTNTSSTPATGSTTNNGSSTTNNSSSSNTASTPATNSGSTASGSSTTTNTTASTPAVSYDAQLSTQKTWTDNQAPQGVMSGDDISLLVRGHNLTADTTATVTATVTDGAVTLGSSTVTIPKDGSISTVDVLPHDQKTNGTLTVTVTDAQGNTLATATASTFVKSSK